MCAEIEAVGWTAEEFMQTTCVRQGRRRDGQAEMEAEFAELCEWACIDYLDNLHIGAVENELTYFVK